MAGSNRARAHKKAKRQAQDYSDILSRCGGAMSKFGLQVDINKLPEVLELALGGCNATTLAEIQNLVMAHPADYRQLRSMGIPQQAHPVMARQPALTAEPAAAPAAAPAHGSSGLVFGVDGEEYEDLVLGGVPKPALAQQTAPATSPVHGTRAERRGTPGVSLQAKLEARLANTEGVQAHRGPDGVIRKLHVSAADPVAPQDEVIDPQEHAHEMAIAQRLALRNRAGQPKPRS